MNPLAAMRRCGRGIVLRKVQKDALASFSSEGKGVSHKREEWRRF
jgi:hypothetical protein